MLKKTKMFSGDPAPFVMELPGLPPCDRRQRASAHVGARLVLHQEGRQIILLSPILVWFLSYFGFVDGTFRMLTDEESALRSSRRSATRSPGSSRRSAGAPGRPPSPPSRASSRRKTSSAPWASSTAAPARSTRASARRLRALRATPSSRSTCSAPPASRRSARSSAR